MEKSQTKVLPIIVVVCTTLVLMSGVAGWVYVQQQTLAQEKALQEQRFKVEKETATIEADAKREAARLACRSTANILSKCL